MTRLLIHARRRTVGAVAAAALTLTATLAPVGAATATPQPVGPTQAAANGRPVDVMTRNLYLGAGLDLIVGAMATGNIDTIKAAATTTWNQVVASDPEERMAAIADEIAAARPAAVGLQEVTEWTTLQLGTSGLQQVEVYDFLDLLLAELEERGVSYHEVEGATADNFASPFIPVNAGATVAVKLADRDVILRRDDVAATNGRNGNFSAILELPDGTDVDRGWGSADLTTKLATFRFVNAHTEAWGPEAIRVAQVTQLFGAQDAITAELGALPMVYVGDYNSDAPRLGEPGEGGYNALDARLDDAWVQANGTALGDTCCQAAELDSTTSQLDDRIDLVMVSDDVQAKKASTTGTTPVDLPGETWWASDHAGVLARLIVGQNATP